jgi:hypothetical protein
MSAPDVYGLTEDRRYFGPLEREHAHGLRKGGRVDGPTGVGEAAHIRDSNGCEGRSCEVPPAHA